ncbi:MAG: hypothetical protein ABI824_06555 [Acidobacteriota bacterium]
MIWQLVKRDQMWIPFLGAMAFFFALLVAAAGRDMLQNPYFGFLPVMMMAQSIGLHLGVLKQRAHYEATLPIETRDWWCSRVLTLLAAVWVPFGVAIASGFPFMQTLEAAAVFTVIALVAKCYRIGDIESPELFPISKAQIAFVLVVAAFVPLIFRHVKMLPPPGLTLPMCAVASLALFWWGWVNVPKSFQIAASRWSVAMKRVATQAEGMHLEERKPTRFVYLPVLRSIYSQPTFSQGSLSFGIFLIFLGLPLVGVLLLVVTQIQFRAQCGWLLSLPFSSRRLFAWIAIPHTVAVVAASLAHFFTTAHPLSPNGQLVELASVLTLLYGLINPIGFLATRPVSRPSTVWGWVVRLTGVLLTLAMSLFPIYLLSNAETIERFAGRIPAAPWQLAGLLAIPVIARYWLAEKAFREQEYRRSNFGRAMNRNTQ